MAGIDKGNMSKTAGCCQMGVAREDDYYTGKLK